MPGAGDGTLKLHCSMQFTFYLRRTFLCLSTSDWCYRMPQLVKKNITHIYIYKVALSVFLFLFATYRPHAFPSAALRDRLKAHSDEEALWRCRTSERFSPLFLPGSQPAANVHRWNRTRCHLFFFVGFPTAASKRVAGCIQSNNPVFFKEPVWRCEDPFSCGSLTSTKKTSRKRRCAQTDHKPGVRGYLREEWTSEWTASKQPTPKRSRPPLIRGWRWDKLSVGWGNTWKLTAAERSFWKDQERMHMATHYSEELERTTAGRMSKQSPEKSTHRSLLMEHRRPDILFCGGTYIAAEQFFKFQ